MAPTSPPETERRRRWTPSASRGDAGSIVLGLTFGSSYAFLPRLATAAAELPRVDLALRELRTLEQMKALDA